MVSYAEDTMDFKFQRIILTPLADDCCSASKSLTLTSKLKISCFLCLKTFEDMYIYYHDRIHII